MWPLIANAVGSAVGSAATEAARSGTQQMMSRGFSKASDEIWGNQSIDLANEMANTLYPGTTPLERLGAGGGGAAQAGSSVASSERLSGAARNMADRQSMMKDKELKVARERMKTDERIADETNKSNLVQTIINNQKIGPYNPSGHVNNTYAAEYLSSKMRPETSVDADIDTQIKYFLDRGFPIPDDVMKRKYPNVTHVGINGIYQQRQKHR